MKNFLITFKKGKNFVEGKTNLEQPFWNEHVSFVEKLYNEGKLKLGGPTSDYEFIYILFAAEDETQVENIFKKDPFIINHIFEIQQIKNWHLYIDSTGKLA